MKVAGSVHVSGSVAHRLRGTAAAPATRPPPGQAGSAGREGGIPSSGEYILTAQTA